MSEAVADCADERRFLDATQRTVIEMYHAIPERESSSLQA